MRPFPATITAVTQQPELFSPTPFDETLPQVMLSSDGACHPNPGRGGWAYVMRFRDHCKEASGFDLATTNNRMELRAIVEGLRCLKRPCAVLIRTDSRTAMAWCEPGSFAKQSARNNGREAWTMVQEYRMLAARHKVSFEWIAGHNGDPDNERCDFLALVQSQPKHRHRKPVCGNASPEDYAKSWFPVKDWTY